MAGVALALFAAIPLGAGAFSGLAVGFLIPSLKWSLLAGFAGLIITNIAVKRVSKSRSIDIFNDETLQLVAVTTFGCCASVAVAIAPVIRHVLILSFNEFVAGLTRIGQTMAQLW